MRTRLLAAIAIIAVGAIALFVARAFTNHGAGSAIASATPSAVPSAEPAAQPTESPVASAEPLPSPSYEPTPSAAPTVNPNLLTLARGAFVRRWSVGGSALGAESLAIGNAWVIDPAFHGSPELEYELPAVAQLSQITIVASGDGASSTKVRIQSATAENGPFADVATVALTGTSEATGTLQSAISTRWLRFWFDRSSNARVEVDSISADGTEAPPAYSFVGRWVLADQITGSGGTVFGNLKGEISTSQPTTGEYEIATARSGDKFEGAVCALDRDVWHGPIAGGTVQLDDGGVLNVVADGALLVGVANDEPVIAKRVAKAPTCAGPTAGSGPTLAVIMRRPNLAGPATDPTYLTGFRFHTIFLPTMSASDLSGARAAILAATCAPTKAFTTQQAGALLKFVSDGHVLVVRDADTCSQSEYTFLPYTFTTAATGARGARGNVLTIADNSILGSSDGSDTAHHVDTQAYLHNPTQQIGDADIMRTDDLHWCGLMFAKNALGISGWVRAYARYGRGVIVYDGFDIDDVSSRVPQALALTRLEYGLSPNADLPCNAHVASVLIVQQSATRTVPFGRAQQLAVGFTVDQAGSDRSNITMSLSGESGPGWRARIDRTSFVLGKMTQHVLVSVSVPRNAAAGAHLFTLTATNERGQNASAALVVSVSETLAKELQKGRARIYGIHFDVASAHIQPQSETIVAQIAGVLREYSRWRMRVEGYTDSDGGAAYNLDLSKRRAQSVVADLVAHYHIARNRLTAAGYGLAKPVASNATDAGKALNRRVELVRL
jgi:outer membrane protein OmpA-like peptidoglycan-associated protein